MRTSRAPIDQADDDARLFLPSQRLEAPANLVEESGSPLGVLGREREVMAARERDKDKRCERHHDRAGGEYDAGAAGREQYPSQCRRAEEGGACCPVRDNVRRRQLLWRPREEGQKDSLRRTCHRECDRCERGQGVRGRIRPPNQQRNRARAERARLRRIRKCLHPGRRVPVSENRAERREEGGRSEQDNRDHARPGRSTDVIGVHEQGDPVGLLDRDEPRVPELGTPKVRVSENSAKNERRQRHG